MNIAHMIKGHLKRTVVTIIYWIFAFWAFDLFRFAGLSDMPGITLDHEVSYLKSLELFIVLGTLTGLLYSIIEEFFERNWFKRKSIGFRLLLKSLFYLVILTLDVELGVEIITSLYDHPHLYTPRILLESGAVWSFIIFFMIASLLFNLWKIILEKFGAGVFWKMLVGKYNPPRVEKRLFMFLDMRSSTTLAETLGYHKFSEMLQHCFYDLNEVVAGYSGEIYQYVGDEAVIVWDYEKGLKNNECVALYFDFAQKLNKNHDFYMKEYGVFPEFKAGLHGGELVAAEVGVVKKEIAYHGDVINTTARIQDMCNKLGEHLLISDTIMNALTLHKEFENKFKGEFELKGKDKPVPLFGIRAV